MDDLDGGTEVPPLQECPKPKLSFVAAALLLMVLIASALAGEMFVRLPAWNGEAAGGEDAEAGGYVVAVDVLSDLYGR